MVENRAGGNSHIGSRAAAQSAPDGYTILLTSPPMTAVAPALIKSMPYNVSTDLIPVSTIITTPNILVVNNDLPIHSVQDFIRLAKEKPQLDLL